MATHPDALAVAWTLTHPQRPWSANERVHWTVRAERTAEWRKVGWAYARGARIPALPAILVDVQVTHPATAVPPDPGNAYPAVKAMIDGLVDARVVPDDGPQHLRRLSFLAPVEGPGWSVTLVVRPTTPGPPPTVARKTKRTSSGTPDRRAGTPIRPRSVP